MWRDVLFLALREIRRNALRSFLTVLGIVIGVAAVITMVTVGGGATDKISSDIANLGSNLLYIVPGQHRGPGRGSVASKRFTERDVAAIREQIGSLRAVAPMVTQAANAVYGNASRSTSVVGTTEEYLVARSWRVREGRAFGDAEVRSGKPICLLGDTVRRELFGAQTAVGQSIRVGKTSCQVIGVLEAKGQSGIGNDQDDSILMPLHTVQRRLAGSNDVAAIMVSVSASVSTEKAARDVRMLLQERRRIGSGDDDDFSVLDMKELAATLTGTTKVLTALLGAVAGVSLLVGGIGIMNIMLVSVTERTREIGTRMAIGALEHEILLQFLVEAIVLSSLGGIVGIALAVVASASISSAMQLSFSLDLGVVAGAFLFSGAIGVVFGFFPARRAARLDPIEALRHE